MSPNLHTSPGPELTPPPGPLPVALQSSPSAPSFLVSMAEVRAAQERWSAVAVRQRVALLPRFRAGLAAAGHDFARAAAAARRRSAAEILSAEVLPLADACRFLERNAVRALATRAPKWWGRPLWLTGSAVQIIREPLGVVLVIGPGNYPLFLPGVQILQALTAGNAVLLKPGRGGTPAAQLLALLLSKAGLPENLVTILDEAPAAAAAVISTGVDKVLLTGSAATGRAILTQLARTLTPATVELSGVDAVVVRADADVTMAARAVAFGLRLNAGATCIAPRRLFVHAGVVDDFKTALREALDLSPGDRIARETLGEFGDALLSELKPFPHPVCGGFGSQDDVGTPLVFEVAADSRLLGMEWFAGVALLVRVGDDAEAIRLACASPYGLGASVFSRDTATAGAVARQLPVGVVTINDLIVPTADPRLPFAGRRHSGFGSTRGLEGLLELTIPKVIALRSGTWRPHYDPERPAAAEFFSAYIRLAHGRGWAGRWAALRDFVRLAFHSARATRQQGRPPKPTSVDPPGAGVPPVHP